MITIKKYNKKDLSAWDQFVNNSINGTIFQTQKFINYHITRKFNNCSLIIKYKNEIVSVLPGAIIKKKSNKILYSHPGTSYGGLIISRQANFDLLNQVLHSIDNFCVQNNFNQIILINSPNIYSQYIDNSLEYLLRWNNYHEKEVYISHAVGLTQIKNVGELLSKRKLRYIKNSPILQNVSFHRTGQLEGFYELLSQSKARHGVQPTHSLKELQQIQAIYPTKVKIIVSKVGKKTVGGMVLFLTNSRVCLVFYNVTSPDYRKSQLSVLQLYYCLGFAQQHKFQYVDFGVSHTPEKNNPLTPKFSLIQFKEQFGAKGVLRTVYQKKYVLK